MTALDDRRMWLTHLDECTQCPVNRCPRGDELAAAVRETLTPGDSWQGVYRPRETEHGPAKMIGVESPNAPRPVGLTLEIAEMLRRIETNYMLFGSGPLSPFEGKMVEDVQAEAVTLLYLERFGVAP